MRFAHRKGNDTIPQNKLILSFQELPAFDPLTRALPTLSLEGEDMLSNPSPSREKVALRAG
jgi:hypothetical protein